MNGFEKALGKKSDPKDRKNGKNQSEIAACEQKAHFCSNAVFSFYFTTIRKAKITPQKHSLFPSTLFRHDRNAIAI